MRRIVLAGSAASFLAACASAEPAPAPATTAVVEAAPAAASEAPPVAEAVVDLKPEFDAVKAEFDNANQAFMTAYRAAKDDDGRKAALAQRPNPGDYVPRMQAIAAKDAKDAAAAECFAWIIQNAAFDFRATGQAFDALAADHLSSPVIAQVCTAAMYSGAAERDAFLRKVFEQCPDRAARARAGYVLAHHAAAGGREKEAADLFAVVTEKYGDLKHGNGTYAERIKGDLYELNNLSVGKAAPEIVGEDENGKAMNLSDFRGKVVMLDFWGFW